MFKVLYRLGVKLATKLRLYETRIDRYLEVIEPYISSTGVILDLGCGRGDLTRRLHGKTRWAVALDIDCEALSSIDGLSIMKLCADAENIPLRDESIDTVIAISLLEHLPHPKKSLHGINRILKWGGYLIIQLPNLQYYVEPHTKFPLFLLPHKLKETIRARIDYPYINFKVTI